MGAPQTLRLTIKFLLLCTLYFFCSSYSTYAQPANDNCSSPEVIPVPNNGFGIGTFTSTNVNIDQATIQTSETFAPAILVAGQNQKSVWFKFKVGSTRKIRVTLQQPGSVIQAGDVGFAVYKANTCLPATSALSTQLTPIATFGNTFHPCAEGGDYLVQVSSKAATAGLLSIQVEVDFTGAQYDRMQDAYQFGALGTPVYTKYVDFSVECQSLDDANELCYPINSAGYTKSTWHTFTTPAYLDWLSIILSAPNGATGTQIIGYRIYKGDARSVSSLSALIPVGTCDSFAFNNGYWPPYKTYKCGDLDPSTTYSLQLFYKQNFNQSVRATIAYGGTAPTKAPEPILSSMGANQLGVLAPSGAPYTYTDYFACNSRHAIHPCGNALPATGIAYSNTTYNLSTFYTFTLTAAANINLGAGTSVCNFPYLLIRLYQQGVTNNCADLSNSTLVNSATSNLNVECLMPGTYTVQVMGQEAPINYNNYALTSTNLTGSGQLCMLSSLGQKLDFSIRVSTATALNQFALQTAGAYDKINASVPLQSGVTYQAATDVFGCSPTVLPDTICYTTHNKAMYRQFVVADSGLVTFTNKKQNFYYKLFKGDADALANQQNKHAYPQRITGLVPTSMCLTYYSSSYDEDCRPDKACVLPGTYTFTTFGSSNNYIGVQDNPKIKFDSHVSRHSNPVLAQNMGSILDSSVAARTSDIDYFSCTDNAVAINGYQPCVISYNNSPATKAIYRQFYLRAESIVSISGIYDCAYNNIASYLNNKTLFSGKATDGLNSLQVLPAPWRCFSSTQTNSCTTLPAGWYTVVSYGAGASYQNPLNNAGPYSYINMIGYKDQFTITVTPACPGQKFNRPYRASVNQSTNQPYVVDWPARFVTAPSVALAAEQFNCSVDTPFVDGITTCAPVYNRASYYVFRVVRTTSLQVLANSTFSLSLPFSIYPLDIRTDSALLPTTTPVAQCSYTGTGSQVCSLQPGIYTLVLFAGAAQNCTTVSVTLTKPCNDPLYNRPYKAAVDPATNQPFLVDYGPGVGNTAAYPVTDKTINLPEEYFTCKSDTPFSSHPIISCNPSATKVAYYVFKTVRETYIQINTKGQWGAVYSLDVRNDSALMTTTAPVQPCLASNGYIQLCRLPAGTYTLVIFPLYNYSTCLNVVPVIYVDQPGYSRFDRAAKAYDFGNVPTDNVWHNGKIGDINPLDPTRAPSNDFFYCTTGSSLNDPADGACNTAYNPRVYGDSTRYLFNSSTLLRATRRNLWYTFVATQGGTIKVKVENKSPDKQQYKFRYTIYKSNVDGSIPFNTVVSTGQVDSTYAQGLSSIITNINTNTYYCYTGLTEVSFFRPPCTTAPERYYILIETPGGDYNSSGYYDPGVQPNSQVEVSVLIDPVSVTPTLFDHYSQAGNMGNLTSGTFNGPTDNFTCATRDATDPLYDPNVFSGYLPLYYCTKNIWYKFTTNVTGNILYRISVGGTTSYYNYTDVQLFRQTVPGDSTSVGLKYQAVSAISDGGYLWSQICITPGTYYLLLPGCYRQNETVFPIVKITEQAGDFCSAPVVATLNGAGQATASAIINCHTIGTDYGEFNPMLTCPANTPTNTYKSTWYRLDITGNDTLDVTAYLNENTSASSAQIKYRMMTGNCGAMQEQSCVLDALTQNTYKCLGPGSYFFQVFSPVTATGSIDLKLNAVHHADTCAPFNNCLANANFLHQFDCNTSDSVRFINYSTYGSDIRYSWNFGYNGQTSNAVSPSFFYPALTTSQTYNVKLVARNIGCNKADSVTIPITIPARPYVNLGNDTAVCDGSAIVLNATSHPGTTYQWNNGAATPTFTTNIVSGSWVTYWVKVTYNGCTRRDTIRVFRNTIVGRNQNKTICPNDSVQLVSTRGIGETYQWSTGAITNSIYASIPGTYYCDVKINGCVKRDTFNVTAAGNFSFGADTGVCIRPGHPFVLNATTAGAISYLWQNGSTNATFNVTAPGQFWVKINFGNCFVQDTINLSNMQPIVRSNTASLCAGHSYTLPSGAIVNTPGIYADTARAVGGCDSLISTTTLILKSVSTQNSTASICQGQTYALPWGVAVSVAGSYRDTLRSPTDGCDSIIRTVALTVVNPVLQTTNVSICAGQTYTLPSGAVVSVAGSYRDTVHYMSGCDSLVTSLQLTVKTVQAVTSNHSICPGQLFTLPSGSVVNTAGTFYDTLHYVSGGCDSIRYTINLVVGLPATTTLNAFVCAGVSYTLPSGIVVNTAGTYHDTLHHVIGGCDSIHYTVIVANRQVTTASISVAICAGQNYVLPSGATINAAGVYKDTLRYTEGCDSLINTFTITSRNVINQNLAASVCAGHSYTLPSGLVVNNAGIYKDTLRYVAGCDSVITTVNLQVAQISTAVLSPVICQGQSYTMPSGITIHTAGIYKDTLKSSMGCDSVITTVTLTTMPKPAMGINPSVASVCEGDSLQLKAFGGVTYRWIQGSGILSPAAATTWIYPPMAGAYKVIISEPVCNSNDTIQSIIKIEPLPQVSITKSHDVTCIQGAAQLVAKGGSRYIWWPATGLTSNTINNPLASPLVTTTYHVQAISNNNCVAEDSIEVKVIKGDAGEGYLVPSAFTPNNDGNNDCFGIRTWGTVTNLRFDVFDRYGMLVFSTTDASKCWDGKYKGEALAPAAFVYIIKANTVCGPIERKGTVVLIR